MYIGNGMLLILNLPLIPAWIQVLKLPYRILFPMIILFENINLSYQIKTTRIMLKYFMFDTVVITSAKLRILLLKKQVLLPIFM